MLKLICVVPGLIASDPLSNKSFSMLRKTVLFVAIACGLPYSQSAHAQNTQRGAILGGLGGAVVGGLIGDHNDKAGAGAAIGGAIGAVGGAVLGNARDKEITAQRQQQYYYNQQQSYATQQRQVAQVQSAVSFADVISMSRSGLSDPVVINQIQTRGVQQQPQVSDIIMMHQQGVSDTVITAMQSARIGSAPQVIETAPVVVQPSPIYVQERVIVPAYQPPPVYHVHGYHYHRGSYHRW